MKSVFTDKQLSDLYLKLKKDYRENEQIDQNFNRMGWELNCAFSPGGIYHSLPEEEKEKVRTVFAAFFNMKNASYQQPVFSQTYWDRTYPQRPMVNVYPIHCHHYDDSWWRTFFLWQLLSNQSPPPASSSEKKKSSNGESAFLLFVVGLVLITAVLASLYYLLLVLADGIERWQNDEGQLYASFSFIMMAASAGAGYLAWGLILLPMLQPAGILAVLGLAATMGVTSALTTGLTRAIFSWVESFRHAEALDPNDPFRFVPPANVDARFDLVKVKFAMAVMRDEIGALPSALNRFFSSDPKVQEKQRLLELIRDFRCGMLPNEGYIVVAGQSISLLQTSVAPVDVYQAA